MNYYTSINRIISFFFIVALLNSCETSRTTFKTETIKIDNSFKGLYNSNNIGIDSADLARYKNVTLLRLFGIYSDNVLNVVELHFIENDRLEINYTDSLIKKTKILNGNFSKNGYYQCFIKRKVIQIPPLIPFIYSRRLIDRLRIGVNQTGELLIQNKYVAEGNIFIFGAGESYKKIYHFKALTEIK